jgi:hypothetical protein
MAKETVPNRRYTDEFKLEALRLAESVGINQAAKRLGMPSSSLGNWARLKRSGKLGELPRAGPIEGSPTELEGAAHGCKSKFRQLIPAHEAGIAQPLTIPDMATDAACGSDRAISGPSLIALWPVTLA